MEIPITTTIIAAVTTTATDTTTSTDTATTNSGNTSNNSFKMNYAPHHGHFSTHAGENLVDEIAFMHEQGFRAIEDNKFLGRPISEQKAIGAQLERLGMSMGVFVVDAGDHWKPSLATGKQEFEDNFLHTCKRSIEAAKRCNATWLTVVPGFFDRSIPLGLQYANVIGTLRKAAALFEPHNLVMVIETLSDTPDLLLQKTDETFLICRAVNSSSCKILYDFYHMQRNEGDLLKTVDLFWDEIAYFQMGDNPGRNEPGTGEINYKQIMRHLYIKGYKGIVGMEHRKSEEGLQGELKLIAAYKNIDNFEE